MISAQIKSLTAYLFLGLVFALSVGTAQAQFVESDERAILTVDEGINFSKDSLFLMNLRFRMQSRAGFNTIAGDDLGVDEFEMRVRRLRLWFDCFVLNPIFHYYILTAFTYCPYYLYHTVMAFPV